MIYSSVFVRAFIGAELNSQVVKLNCILISQALLISLYFATFYVQARLNRFRVTSIENFKDSKRLALAISIFSIFGLSFWQIWESVEVITHLDSYY